jgi:hypothetical protein
MYYSPIQSAVYVGGMWLDDICAINWSVQDNKIPLYSYNDTRVRAFAKGRTLAQGRLAVNFQRPGFLMSAIKEKSSKDQRLLVSPGITNKSLNKNSPTDSTISVGTKFLQDITQELLRGGKEDSYELGLDVLRAKFWHETKFLTNEEINPSKFYIQKDNINNINPNSGHIKNWRDIEGKVQLLVGYGRVETGQVHYYYVLDDVQFTNVSQFIDSDPPGDSQPIKEVYDFIFKDVNIMVQSEYTEDPRKVSNAVSDAVGG